MHKFKKNFGQNFLRGSKYPRILLQSLSLTPEDTVIEIGPGDGIVTKLLLEAGVKVICIEVDYDLLPNLIKKFGNNENFNLIHQDVLQVDFKEVLDKSKATTSVKVIGSLPYNISKKIIDNFIQFELNSRREELSNNVKSYHIISMAFIIQEEVAKDYTAQAPKASFLSNYLKIFTENRKLQSIPAEQFFPKPKVNGGILSITFKESIQENHEDLVKLLRIGFTNPRKTLLKNLKNSNKFAPELLTETFNKLNLSKERASEITSEQWGELLLNLHSTELK